MEVVHLKKFQVRSYELDFTGRIRPTALLNYMQEAATDHAALLGIDVSHLMPLGLTWVLSRTHLKMIDPVCSCGDIRIRTWPSTREGRFSCREFEITGGDGSLAAVATCSFAVLDLETRKAVVIDERLPDYPLLPQRALDDQFPTLPRLASPEHELSFRVGLADLDVNRHANNVAYAVWALETVPTEVVEQHTLADLEIAYRAEVFHGETVLARCSQVNGNEGPVFHHQLVREGDGMEVTRLVSRWRAGC